MCPCVEGEAVACCRSRVVSIAGRILMDAYGCSDIRGVAPHSSGARGDRIMGRGGSIDHGQPQLSDGCAVGINPLEP